MGIGKDPGMNCGRGSSQDRFETTSKRLSLGWEGSTTMVSSGVANILNLLLSDMSFVTMVSFCNFSLFVNISLRLMLNCVFWELLVLQVMFFVAVAVLLFV